MTDQARGQPELDDPRVEEAADALGEGIPEGAALGVDLQEQAESADDSLLGQLGKLFGFAQRTMQPVEDEPIDLSEEPRGETIDAAAALGAMLAQFTREAARPQPWPVAGSGRVAFGYVEVGTDPIELVGKNRDRMRLMLTNRDASLTVYLAGSRAECNGAAPNGGSGTFDLQAGETLPIDTHGPIWAVLNEDETTQAVVRIIQEYPE